METGVTLLANDTKNDKDVKPSCPECSSHLIFDVNHGEYICQSCGYVVLEKMDYCGHETHSNNSDDRLKNLRGSGQTSSLWRNYGLQTEIGESDKDKTANQSILPMLNVLHVYVSCTLDLRH